MSADRWLENVEIIESPNCDFRQTHQESLVDINLLVIHNISLPPAKSDDDFANDNVEAFFCNCLNIDLHPVFKELEQVKVSSHLYIKRCGKVIQFVPLNKRAWHAGISSFEGREKCNEYSIGIELQGTDILPYTEEQYRSLVAITTQIQNIYPGITNDRIVGHEDIAPGRKTDPGRSFDWSKYKSGLTTDNG